MKTLSVNTFKLIKDFGNQLLTTSSNYQHTNKQIEPDKSGSICKIHLEKMGALHTAENYANNKIILISTQNIMITASWTEQHYAFRQLIAFVKVA